MASEASSDPLVTPTKNATKAATAATVEKVMRSVNVVLSKSEKLDRYASSAAEQAHALCEAHVPVVLQYLPENKVNKEFMFVLTVTLAIIGLFVVGAGNLLLDLTGVMYPMYATILAVESPEKDDDTQWLTYWLIFCFIKVTEKMCFPLLRLIPMFPFVKMFFLVWLYHPVFMGAKVLYGLFRPALLGLVTCADPMCSGLHGSSFSSGAEGETAAAAGSSSGSKAYNSRRSSVGEGGGKRGGSRRLSLGTEKENMKEVDRNGGVVKQLQVMVQTLSRTRDKDEVGTLNATLVQLIVVPAAGKEMWG